jgi:hypothetical protein
MVMHAKERGDVMEDYVDQKSSHSSLVDK